MHVSVAIAFTQSEILSYICIHTVPVLLMNLVYQNMLKAGHPLRAPQPVCHYFGNEIWIGFWFPLIITPQVACHYFGSEIWIGFLLLFHLNLHVTILKSEIWIGFPQLFHVNWHVTILKMKSELVSSDYFTSNSTLPLLNKLHIIRMKISGRIWTKFTTWIFGGLVVHWAY